MAPRLSLLPLSLLVLLFALYSTAKATTLRETNGEKLIRELNLHPKHSVNLRRPVNFTASPTVTKSPRLVETQLMFPVVSGAGAPGPSDLGHHAGYYSLPDTVGAKMFYFFFESRTSKADPVVIWLTGGPGCSSELALFYENGPFKINKDMSLVWNDYGWDKVSNLIYVDQPTGTGFSYSSSEEDLRHDEKGVSNDLYNFLQEFFKAHPEYANNDFFITGESYAGHYIPAFASRINLGNKNKEGIPINLKGFGIGNGLTEPGIQYPAYPDFALNMSFITQSDYQEIIQMIPDCQAAVKQCGTSGTDTCIDALYTCETIFNEILDIAGNINYYDIRKKCEGSLCYDFSNMETYLNMAEVRKALGVGNIEFVSCSQDVYQAMQVDWMRNLETVIPPLLEEGINLLVYAGEYDLICNWLGNSKWVNAMAWSGQSGFVAAPTVPFLVDGKEAGLLKTHGALSFLKVHNAGHMVPMDQPNNSLQMLQKWTQGKLSSNGKARVGLI